jgi:hypothetical protein
MSGRPLVVRFWGWKHSNGVLCEIVVSRPVVQICTVYCTMTLWFPKHAVRTLKLNSVLEGNRSIGGCGEQYLVYSLQLASRLDVCKLITNKSNKHSCLDVGTSFVICHSLMNRHYTIRHGR